jgi:PAS domain S-box-containing protein
MVIISDYRLQAILSGTTYRNPGIDMADEGKSAAPPAPGCLPHQREEENLREEGARLQAILDTTVDGIITINELGIVESFNKAAERIFGYPASEVIGNNVKMLMPLPYREEHATYLDNYLRTGNRKIIGTGREVAGRRKDGSTFPLYLAVSEVWVGRRRIFTGILSDVTERKKAEEDLKRVKDELKRRVEERTAQLLASNARLERINRDLQEFLFVASNDLQEPLRKIQILNDRIRGTSCGSLDKKELDHFEKVQYEAKRMQDSIQALLGYSRIAARAGPFVMVDLNRVFRDVLRDLEEFVEKTNARIEIGKLPAIEADPRQMHRLFLNIVDNALKFHGAESPVIRIRGRRLKEKVEEQAAGLHHDKFCRIALEDNGIGFDEKYLDRVFMPFKRLHARSSSYEGTGMGLSICRKIAEVHGGTITARSTPGKGSTFIVILPVRQLKY